MTYFACDVSEWQPPVDDSYPHRWLIFRAVNETGRIDYCFARNLAWARKAVATGRLEGYTVYVVFWPGRSAQIVQALQGATGQPDEAMTVMIDVESWSKAIVGDHSDDIEGLCTALADWLGDARRVFGYGNVGDLNAIWPRRKCPAIAASYGPHAPDVDHFGWQYTDGRPDLYGSPEGWPTSSAPFGACDHNYFEASPRELLGLDAPAAQEDDMMKMVTTKNAAGHTVGAVLVGNGRPDLLGAAEVSAYSEIGVPLLVIDGAHYQTFRDIADAPVVSASTDTAVLLAAIKALPAATVAAIKAAL